MNKTGYKQNMIAGAIVALLGAVAFALTFQMPAKAAMFPRFGSSLLFLFGGILLLTNTLRSKGGTDSVHNEEAVDISSFLYPMHSMLIIIGYVASFHILGFYPATILMIACFMYYLGCRSWTKICATTTIITIVIYLVFSLQLEVPLPVGML